MKKIIVGLMIICLFSLNISQVNALENENAFILWTNQIFNNNNDYDVENKAGESVLEKFVKENQCYYDNNNFDMISQNFMENGYSYSRIVIEPIFLDTQSKSVESKEWLDQYTQRGKTIIIGTKMTSTLRIDTNTGKIHSYSGPYLSLTYDNAGYSFTTNLINASTNATYSSSHLTITFSCSYKAQSVAGFTEGGVRLEYTSPVFSHSFSAG